MSALFFKVSWAHNVEKYRDLQKLAKRNGRRLSVKNMSRMRGVPIFLFFLSIPGESDRQQSFSNLDEVHAALSPIGGDA
jgi:hypothetical protein